MIFLTEEINRMLDEFIDKYESDTGNKSSREAMISGIVRNAYEDYFMGD